MKANPMDQSIATDTTTLSNPNWREGMNRLVLEAYLRADPSLPPVRATLGKMMAMVPNGGGPEALAGLQRCISVLEALASIPAPDRAILAGDLPMSDVLGLTGIEALAVRLRRQREVFRSNPVLEAAWNDWEADEERARAAREKDDAARLAAANAAEVRRVETVAAMLAMHSRGVRLHVTAQGRVAAWPASLMHKADFELLNGRNAELARAIADEWAY